MEKNGVYTETEFAILTNDIYKAWSGKTAVNIKNTKVLEKKI